MPGYIAIILFALAAVFGLSILVRWLNNREAPRAVTVLHGVFAATGIGLLVYYATQHGDNYPKLSLVLFIVAAIGGFYILYRDLKKNMHPLAFALVHALVALGGMVSLIVFMFD